MRYLGFHFVFHLHLYAVCVYVVCVGFMPPLPVFAQDTELETITVVAEPEPQTGDVQPDEYAGSHQHIDQQALQRQDVNLGDILANETGVQFRQIGGLGTLTTATVRGASSAQTGVFLDGIMLNSAGNGTIDLSLLELLNLSSVDIYRGSAPAQLNNANIGGAINLRTLYAEKTKPSAKASFTIGSFATNRYQFTHRSSHNKLDFVAAASREQSNNRFKFDNDNATPLNPLDDRTEKRNNAQVTKSSALGRVGFQWSKDARSDFLMQATDRELGVPEWLNAEDNEASFDTDALELQLVNRLDGIGNWNTSLSLFQHHQNNHYQDILDQVGLGVQNTRSNSKTVGLKAYWERIGDRGTFSFNTSIRNELLESLDAKSNNQNFSVEREALVSTVQYAFFSINDRLLITPSLRVHRVMDSFNGINQTTVKLRNNTNLNSQIGLRFVANEQLTWRATLGKFIREPGFSELFGSTGLIVGNRKLLAEQGINADLGVTYLPSASIQLNASVFGSWRDELIVLEFDSQGIGRSINSGKANVFGLEMGNDWTINKRLNLRLNATAQQTQNFAPNPALNNNELPGEAQLSSHAKLQYRSANTRLWFESNYKSDFYYDLTNLRPAKGYLLHNIGIEYQWKDVSVGLTVNNFGNHSTEEFNGFPRPGRSYYFSLSHRL